MGNGPAEIRWAKGIGREGEENERGGAGDIGLPAEGLVHGKDAGFVRSSGDTRLNSRTLLQVNE